MLADVVGTLTGSGALLLGKSATIPSRWLISNAAYLRMFK
jgi:hypothetical protein